LQKGIVYYLSIKTALILIFLLTVFAALPLPFSPIQIILLELFMDLGASAGFVAEPAEAEIITRMPHHREEKIISRPIVARILTKGIILFSVVIAVYLSAISAGYPFVLVQTSATLGLDFRACRSGIYIPALQAPLNLSPLPPQVMIYIAVGVTAGIVLADSVRRLIFGRLYPEPSGEQVVMGCMPGMRIKGPFPEKE
jgi:magnesium-transporting ATPase (P-type)